MRTPRSGSAARTTGPRLAARCPPCPRLPRHLFPVVTTPALHVSVLLILIPSRQNASPTRQGRCVRILEYLENTFAYYFRTGSRICSTFLCY